jgi:hypothetical protein
MRILLISPEAWGDSFVSKHHYANFLAEQHEIFFLEPANGYAKIPFGNMQVRLVPEKKGLTLVRYKNLLPRLNSVPAWLRKKTYATQAKRILKQLGHFDLVWSFDPRRYTDQNVWKAGKTIYHSVDLHPDSGEKQMCETSSLVVALSERIQSGLQKHRPDVLRVGHGCHIDPVMEIHQPATLPGKNKIKAIYTGNFHRHIDYRLMTGLAADNPDVDFILVGPTEPNHLSKRTISTGDLHHLEQQPNIYLTGSLPANSLYSYLLAADICLVLFKKEFEIIHHAPHKMMAYFAAGKVVVSNPIETYRDEPPYLVRMEETGNIRSLFTDTKNNIAYWNSPELSGQRKAYAAQHHYRLKIREILAEAEK